MSKSSIYRFHQEHVVAVRLWEHKTLVIWHWIAFSSIILTQNRARRIKEYLKSYRECASGEQKAEEPIIVHNSIQHVFGQH